MSEFGQEAGEGHCLMAAARTRWQRLKDSMFGRDIALVLALKAALVVVLYLILFRPARHPAEDPSATAAAVVGTATATVHEVQ